MALDTKTDEAERDLRREALAAKSKDTTLGKDEGFWAKIGEMLASLLLSGGDKKETKEPDTLAYKGYTAPPEKGPQPELRMIVKPTLEPELKYIALAKPKEEPSPLLFTKAVPDSKVVPDPDYDAFRAQIDAAKQPEAPKETPKEAVSPPDPAKVKAADEAWKKLQDTESTQDKDAAARLQATREKLLSDAFPSPQPDSRPDKPAAQANANPDLKTFAAWQAAHQGVVDAQASFDVTKDRQDPESKKIN
ncbi:MAG: hypothetical protein JO089_03755, partial [Alphaproteobacteria bacterium]|nr:hypothetical protein [Alphaproteobacteria bacterium]